MTQAKVVLDTCIVSYLMKNTPEADAYIPHVRNKLLAISFITVGELYFGAENAGWGKRKRDQLEAMLHNFVVIPYDHQIAQCYGRLVTERQKSGNRIEPNDAWIAACTVRHNVPLITHNPKDFKLITGLDVITECPNP